LSKYLITVGLSQGFSDYGQQTPRGPRCAAARGSASKQGHRQSCTLEKW